MEQMLQRDDAPVVVKAGGGWRWLAVTCEGSACHFAVLGNSEDEARQKFKDSANRWRELLAEGRTPDEA